jgi:hypothetical protein
MLDPARMMILSTGREGNRLAHLGQIQHNLNTDHAYRSRFLKDPVAALAEQGLTLSIEQQEQLRRMVTQAQASTASVPGAAAGGGRTIFVFDSAGPIRSGSGVPLIIAFE